MHAVSIMLGGKERPVYFGLSALRRYCKLTNTKLADLGETMKEYGVELIFCGLQDGIRKAIKDGEKVELDQFDIDDLCDWLDERPEAIDEAMQHFLEMQAPGQSGETPKKASQSKKK